MNTITMTWRQFKKVCNTGEYPRLCFVVDPSPGKCRQSTCPIWKRAERKQEKGRCATCDEKGCDGLRVYTDCKLWKARKT